MGSTSQAGRPTGIGAVAAEGRVDGFRPVGSGSSGDAMRAVVPDASGSADVLRLAEIGKPHIAPNEVLVKVRAAGVDRGTWHLLAGQPYLMRILGFGFRGPKNRVPGLDVAGTVVTVGSDVKRFRARRGGIRHRPGLVRRVPGGTRGQARPVHPSTIGISSHR